MCLWPVEKPVFLNLLFSDFNILYLGYENVLLFIYTAFTNISTIFFSC